MEAFLVSTGIIALAEIGDKTQLLAILLATRYRKPAPIVLGILIATLANHALAATLGAWLANAIGPAPLRWILAALFLVMAVWTLIPDRHEEQTTNKPRHGIFLTTAVAFFLIEMGDKTQIATAALAAHYQPALLIVIAASTLGMMLANVPAVLLGATLAHKLPLRAIRIAAAALFALIAIDIAVGIVWRGP